MRSSPKDQAEGAFHEATGKAKGMAGKIRDASSLEIEGKEKKTAGSLDKQISKVEKALRGSSVSDEPCVDVYCCDLRC